MKVYEFGKKSAPALLLLPGTCCHWKGNFGRVIPLLETDFRVLCVSYDGFDETENTEFPTMLEETEKIEAYIKEHCFAIRPQKPCAVVQALQERTTGKKWLRQVARLRDDGCAL